MLPFASQSVLSLCVCVLGNLYGVFSCMNVLAEVWKKVICLIIRLRMTCNHPWCWEWLGVWTCSTWPCATGKSGGYGGCKGGYDAWGGSMKGFDPSWSWDMGPKGDGLSRHQKVSWFCSIAACQQGYGDSQGGVLMAQGHLLGPGVKSLGALMFNLLWREQSLIELFHDDSSWAIFCFYTWIWSARIQA